jgi:hypothetical protein
MSEQIIFVLGVGRSGTSLLQSMLCSHPYISFPPETHFFRKYVASKRYRSKLEEDGPEAFIELLAHDSDYSRISIDPDDLMLGYVGGEKIFLLKNVYIDMLSMYATNHGKVVIGDKDPRNLDYLEEIKLHYPDALILHIIRDPRDVILSRTKANWSKSMPFILHPLICQAQLKCNQPLGGKLFSSNYIEVHYEDLITRPPEVLNEVCQKIGINYDSAMLTFSESAKTLVSKSEMQWKSETLGPILGNNLGKWKKSLSATRIFLSESICLYAFETYPNLYHRSKIRNSYKWKIFRFSLKIISIVFTRFYKLRKYWI